MAGFSSNGLNDDFALARYSPNGSLDTSFDLDGKVSTDFGAGFDYAFAFSARQFQRESQKVRPAAAL